jgi:hypothetical protein
LRALGEIPRARPSVQSAVLDTSGARGLSCVSPLLRKCNDPDRYRIELVDRSGE